MLRPLQGQNLDGFVLDTGDDSTAHVSQIDPSVSLEKPPLVGFVSVCGSAPSCWGFLAPELRSSVEDENTNYEYENMNIQIFTVPCLLFTLLTSQTLQPLPGSST